MISEGSCESEDAENPALQKKRLFKTFSNRKHHNIINLLYF